MLKRLGKGLDKRAQETMGMPFGLIFTIMLIVLFIVIAFIVIKHFVSIGDCAKVGLFYNNFQTKVNEALESQSFSNVTFAVSLPSGVKKVCFGNLTAEITNPADFDAIHFYQFQDANMFLSPPEQACDMPYKLIKYINITRITSSSNPYCVDVSKGLQIKKDFYDKRVIIQ